MVNAAYRCTCRWGPSLTPHHDINIIATNGRISSSLPAATNTFGTLFGLFTFDGWECDELKLRVGVKFNELNDSGR